MMASAIEDLSSLMRSYSYEWLPPHMSELRVVLLGNSWIQRSLVGNFLLNQTVFDPGTEPQCSKIARGQTITVINTPDLLHPDITEGRLTEAIEEFAELSKPGPHVFLLVLAPENFTELQQLKLQSIIEKFTEQPFDHSMVLITTDTEESLGAGYINSHFIQEMIIKCRYRHMCLKDFEEQEIMLKNFRLAELLARVGQIAKENSGDHLNYKEITPIGQTADLSSAAQNPHFTNLRILLFGKSEVKKELLRNFITTGQSSQSGSSSTKRKQVTVKTPNLFNLPVGEVREEIKRCVLQCSPGPNVLLLLVNPYDFTEENRETLVFLLMLFGPRVFKHCIVIFTDQEQKTDCIYNLLYSCEFRSYEMNEDNLSQLMETMQIMVHRNDGSYVTDNFLELLRKEGTFMLGPSPKPFSLPYPPLPPPSSHEDPLIKLRKRKKDGDTE